MARVLFLPAARDDVFEARDWYAARGAGLGDAFVAEINRQVLRIAEGPFVAPVIVTDVRRVVVQRFPYGLFYRVVDHDAVVVACFHASRDPRRWRDRLGD